MRTRGTIDAMRPIRSNPRRSSYIKVGGSAARSHRAGTIFGNPADGNHGLARPRRSHFERKAAQSKPISRNRRRKDGEVPGVGRQGVRRLRRFTQIDQGEGSKMKPVNRSVSSLVFPSAEIAAICGRFPQIEANRAGTRPTAESAEGTQSGARGRERGPYLTDANGGGSRRSKPIHGGNENLLTTRCYRRLSAYSAGANEPNRGSRATRPGPTRSLSTLLGYESDARKRTHFPRAIACAPRGSRGVDAARTKPIWGARRRPERGRLMRRFPRIASG
jgi:hypothetical protein